MYRGTRILVCRCSTGCRGRDPTLRKSHRAERETGWLLKSFVYGRDGTGGRRYSKRAGIRLERGGFVFGESLARARRKPRFAGVPRVMFKKYAAMIARTVHEKSVQSRGNLAARWRELILLFAERRFLRVRGIPPIVSELFVRSSPTFTDSSSSVDYGCSCIKTYTLPVKNSGKRSLHSRFVHAIVIGYSGQTCFDKNGHSFRGRGKKG